MAISRPATGFTSAYTYNPVGTPGDMGEAKYTVSASAHDVHSAFADFADHTLGTAAGRYMTVNGAPSQVAVYTSGPIAVHGGRYNFSAWLASVYPVSPAILAFTITPNAGSAFSIGTFNAPPVVATWTQAGSDFLLASNVTSVTLSLVNNNTDFNGNDFAIDDLSLNAVPEPATWSLLIAGFAMVGVAARRRSRAVAA